MVRAHSNDFFYSSTNKAQIRVDGYEWSKVFDGNTQGLSGFVEVSRLSEDSNKDKLLNFGVLFENGIGSVRVRIYKANYFNANNAYNSDNGINLGPISFQP